MTTVKLKTPFSECTHPSIAVEIIPGASSQIELMITTQGQAYKVKFKEIFAYQVMEETYWSSHPLSKISDLPIASGVVWNDSLWIKEFASGGIVSENELRHIVFLGGDQIVDLLVRYFEGEELIQVEKSKA